MGGWVPGEDGISVERCSVGALGRGSVCALKVFNLGVLQGVLQFTICAKLCVTDAPCVGVLGVLYGCSSGVLVEVRARGGVAMECRGVWLPGSPTG